MRQTKLLSDLTYGNIFTESFHCNLCSKNLRDYDALLIHTQEKLHKARVAYDYVPDAARFRNGGPFWNTNENRLNAPRVNLN